MLDPIFEWLFSHPPLGPIVFFALLGIAVVAFVFSIYKLVTLIIEEFNTHRNLVSTVKREREKRLAEIERVHGDVANEIHKLTELAQRQMEGEKVEDEALLVRAAFRRIQRLGEQHDDDETQGWLRAVTDAYRYRVRHLVRAVDSKELSPEVAVGMLDELHRSTVTDLRPHIAKDGRIWFKQPTGPDGRPFELSRIDEAEGG